MYCVCGWALLLLLLPYSISFSFWHILSDAPPSRSPFIIKFIAKVIFPSFGNDFHQFIHLWEINLEKCFTNDLKLCVNRIGWLEVRVRSGKGITFISTLLVFPCFSLRFANTIEGEIKIKIRNRKHTPNVGEEIQRDISLNTIFFQKFLVQWISGWIN